MRELRMIFTCFLVVFMVLKFSGLVDWSWWIVLAPLWIPTLMGLLMILWMLTFGRES
jgi:hypothetical protein